MSAAQQAKAKRRQMRNGYAHLGRAMRRPRITGVAHRTIAESIAAEQNAAARARAMGGTKKKT